MDNNMNDPAYWIQKLDLKKHPEGGYYRETYRSAINITDCELPRCFEGQRSLATSIFYLLESHQVSLFHRLESDETWYFQYGSSASIHIFQEDNYIKHILGPTDHENFEMQVTIPAGNIFGVTINEPKAFGLFGCVVSPGFDFHDFEIIDRRSLMRKYPEHSGIILALTTA